MSAKINFAAAWRAVHTFYFGLIFVHLDSGANNSEKNTMQESVDWCKKNWIVCVVVVIILLWFFKPSVFDRFRGDQTKAASSAGGDDPKNEGVNTRREVADILDSIKQ